MANGCTILHKVTKSTKNNNLGHLLARCSGIWFLGLWTHWASGSLGSLRPKRSLDLLIILGFLDPWTSQPLDPVTFLSHLNPLGPLTLWTLTPQGLCAFWTSSMTWICRHVDISNPEFQAK